MKAIGRKAEKHEFPSPDDILVMIAPDPEDREALRKGEQETGIPAVMLRQFEGMLAIGLRGGLALVRAYHIATQRECYVFGFILPDGGTITGFQPLGELFDGDVVPEHYTTMPSPGAVVN